MRLVTWNINGIRSLKDDWTKVLAPLNPDIICIQETKVTRDNLDEVTAIVEGFSSYFSFSRKRTGYSGVATFCKTDFTPIKSEEGLTGSLPSSKFDDCVGFYDGIAEEFSQEDIRALDSEGRSVLTTHQVEVDGQSRNLVIFNLYCPRADCEKPERESYQLKFYKLVEIRANALMKAGHIVVIVGDINCSHKIIDHCDPYEEFGERPSRRWLDHFLVQPLEGNGSGQASNQEHYDWMVDSEAVQISGHSFVDSFRKFHPEREGAFTCWNTKSKCRLNNYGTRLDYVFVSAKDSDQILTHCDIRPEIMGSDHCPVLATFNLTSLPATKPPKHCTKYFMEFGGKQQKLSAFFSQNSSSQNGTSEKRKPEENLIPVNVSKKPKSFQPVQQKSLYSFFKPSEKTVPKTETVLTNDPFVAKPPDVQTQISEVLDPTKRVQAAEAWKSLMKGPEATPLCPGHKEPAELKTVKKKGPNCGRQFWSCARGEGKVGDPNTRCEFFKWRK